MSLRYDAALASLQARGRLPSLSAAVALGGEPAWSGCLSVDQRVSSATAFRIGSITKTMTAVLALQLRDEGAWSLDDPIGAVVPETGYADVTVRELLAHTGGLQSEPVGPWWERAAGVSSEQLLAANDGSARVAAAGEYHHYSNLGFALLGEGIARLRGASWWQVVQERLLGPLAMGATSYDPPGDHATGRSVDHFAHTLISEPHTDTGAMAPAGQLWSTTGDLLRWADFLAVGHDAVLDAPTLAEMSVPVAPSDSYGLGVRVLPLNGATLIGHTGSMPGFQASLFVDRSSRDAVVVLASATTGLRPDQVPGLFLGADPVPVEAPWVPTVAPVPARVHEVLGLWFWGNTGFGFEWVGGQLVVRDLRTVEISDRFAVGDDDDGILGVEGYHRGERLTVHRDAAGAVSRLECATFVYTRTPYGAHGA